ncbi:uncharacterized protein BT62DRAFT_916489 [Guyanagaster necrorhizus]|uniref:Xylanolytic transcriptional activator regulatory domain-containing protein n=1 Tax=Guyanagaster necrorhizus TaxID=856835 RepID=A0A9P7W3I2_9AGAR|nr:uncharacterized protein BT62DRAFT_916489 [Guyanagaster necrorhizus MCA 3950]KAG7451497.1 hypothetical protein BT62DRAFT_916489 [Guyanagaster necrorhizus MCA 3950]
MSTSRETASSTCGSSSSSRSSTHLHKGSACLNCRGATRAQALEEQISVLQSRIQDLEHPGHSEPSLPLSDPYHRHRPAEFASTTVISQPLQDIDFPIEYRERILQRFVQQSSEVGFFLDISRFVESLSGVSRAQPSPALLSAVYLWGVHLSPISELSAYEPITLQRAIEAAAQGLSVRHPQIIVHCIQAEVLIANYFFRNGRVLEGKYHTTTAVSLVLSARLHRIRLYIGAEAMLLPPVDLVEEGERINAFWTVLILNNCWSAADGSPSNISYSNPDANVDLPWPLDMLSTRKRPFFMSRLPVWESDSGLASMQQQEAARFFATFSTLERVIQRFLEELPSPMTMAAQSSPGATIVIHTLAQMSMIQLHAPFLARNPSSHGRTVEGFRAIVKIIQSVDISRSLFLDPIVGVLWATICKLLMQEISSGQGASVAGNEPLQLLNNVMGAISTGASHWPLLEAQLTDVRRMYTATRRTSGH